MMTYLITLALCWIFVAGLIVLRPRDLQRTSEVRISSFPSVATRKNALSEDGRRDNVVYELRDISKYYSTGASEVRALRGISLSILEGVTAITGPNGSGKSSLLNILGMLEAPTSGSVSYRGRRLDFESPSYRQHFRMMTPAFIFQDLNLFQDQSAEENVAFALTKFGTCYGSALKLARGQLNELGIDRATAARLPRQLSGGQRQRVAIARALLATKEGGAGIILADEPTAAVNSVDAKKVFDRLLDLVRGQQVPLIVVTHDEHLAERADRIVHLEDGAIKK